MGSVGADGDSRNELEEGLINEIKAIGLKLLGLEVSYDEILNLLERAKEILFDVNQEPSESTKGAILALAMALDSVEFMQCEDLNIQIAVASCWNEFLRIAAPEPMSDDNHKLEAIFKLLMVAIKQLSDESPCNYETQWRILETTAKVKSHYIMMDVDNGELVIEMFQIFLNTIRPDHPHDIYKYMRDIMTMVIEKYDGNEISLELLKPLLASVRRDNKNVAPMAWELGKTVIEKCATKLKPILQEAVRSMSLVIDDYAEIVISLYRDTSTGETMDDRKASEALQSDEGVGNDESLPATLRSCEQIVLPDNDEVRSRNMDRVAATFNSDRNKRSFQRKKGKKTNLGHEVAGPSLSSRKESVNGTCSSKGLHSKKKKESLNDQVDDLESSSAIRRQISQMEAGESSSRHKPTKAKLKKNLSQEKKPETTTDVEYGDELVNRRIMVWWPRDKTFYTGTITAFDPAEKKHTVTYDDDAVEVLNLTEEKWEPFVDRKPQEFVRSSRKEEEEADHPPPAEGPLKRPEKTGKRTAGPSKDKHAASSSKRLKRKSHNVLNPQGDSLQNAVHVFDSDDEKETLNLIEENWEPLLRNKPQETQSTQKEEDSDYPPPAKEPVNREKTEKRKAGPSKNKDAGSSSKRSKRESHNVLNSQDKSAQNAVHVVDTQEDAKVSWKNDGENRSGTKENREKTAKGKSGPSKDKDASSSSKRLKRESHDVLNSQGDSDSAQNAVLVVNRPEGSKISPETEAENRPSTEELRPENQTEPNRRISSRSTKGYHYKQRFGRFFS